MLSIQIGSSRELDIGQKTIQTGIFKYPVASAQIETLGLVGDTISNKKHHGGPDQAVYCYSAQDYDWWMEYDYELMDLCDGVVRLPGVSEGADLEAKHWVEQIGYYRPFVYLEES